MTLWHSGLRQLPGGEHRSDWKRRAGKEKAGSRLRKPRAVTSQEKELSPNFISVLVILNLSEHFLSAEQNPPGILGIFELVLSYCN